MTTTTDPVCGKPVDRSGAPEQREYTNQLFYFCSPECASAFDADPQQYASKQEPTVCFECGGTIEQGDITCPHCGASLVAG